MNSHSKSKLKSKRWQKLQTKEYRDAYAEAQLSIEIPFQIRALRKARGWTQDRLAKLSGIPQARISHIEQPGREPLSLRTLYRLSSAFDVGLLVQFVSFSELVHREVVFHPETFDVSSFKDDQLEEVAEVYDIAHFQLQLGQDAVVSWHENVQTKEIVDYWKYYQMPLRNASRHEEAPYVEIYRCIEKNVKTWIKSIPEGTKIEKFKTAVLEPQNPVSSTMPH